MSKLSFRARALDASKPMPIYRAEELPDLPDYSAINRAVPQMPSGMEKEEECEHHLQRAICTGLIIPTPEVSEVTDLQFYERVYPPDYKMPRQLIHMQPLCLEQETPEYDMDTEDEQWLRQHRATPPNMHNSHTTQHLTEMEFEEIMDRLERSSGQTVIKLDDAKLMLGRDDNIMIAVYDYWLNKRLTHKQPLICEVKTESRSGSSANNPYLAFRRRTEKMQTRKNRKNDESSYEKMVKLRRDLSRAVSLLQMVVQREHVKRKILKSTSDVTQVRYSAQDFNGHLLAEVSAVKAVRPQFAVGAVSSNFRATSASSTLYATSYHHGQHRSATAATPTTSRSSAATHIDTARQREKRQYKKRKHRHTLSGLHEIGACSSSEEEASLGATGITGLLSTGTTTTGSIANDDGPYAFKRKPGVMYHKPTPNLFGDLYEIPRNTASTKDNDDPASRDTRFRYTLTSIHHPQPRCIGFARRRLGRGGRVILDRISTPLDSLLSHPDMSEPALPWRRVYREYVSDLQGTTAKCKEEIKRETCQVTSEKCETYRTEESSSASVYDNSLSNGDISLRLAEDRKVAVEQSILRRMQRLKGRKFRRRYSESSTDETEDPFQMPPQETQFGKFLNEVKSEWLHYHPKSPPTTPPIVCEQDPSSQTEFGLMRVTDVTPLIVDMKVLGDLSTNDPPSKTLFNDLSPFATSEFTLRDLYGDSILPLDSDLSLDASGDDSGLLENFSGLTDAMVDSLLSESQIDLKLDLNEAGRKISLSLLPDDGVLPLTTVDEIEINKPSGSNFLWQRRGGPAGAAETLDPPQANNSNRKRPPAGCSAFRLRSMTPCQPIYLPSIGSIDPAPETWTAPGDPSPVPITTNGDAGYHEDVTSKDDVDIKIEMDTEVDVITPSPKKQLVGQIQRKPDGLVIKSDQQSPLCMPTLVNNTPSASPQLVTVAVSESMKVRLQNHLLATHQNSEQTHLVGVLQNGPFSNTQVAMINSGSPRRSISSANVLTASSHPNSTVVHLQQHITTPIMVAQQLGLQQVSANKLKVLHTHPLTSTQKHQLLSNRAGLPSTVAHTGGSLTSPTLTLTHADHSKLQVSGGHMKAGQYIEIKGGVAKSTVTSSAPTLVGMVQTQQPITGLTHIQEVKKRGGQVIATLEGASLKVPQPQQMVTVKGSGAVVGSSMAGTVVRAALPASAIARNHMRHQFQLRGQTLQLTGAGQPVKSVLTPNLVDKLRLQNLKGATPTLTVNTAQPNINANLLQQVKTSLAGTVVANLIHKPAGMVQNIQIQKASPGQQKITISAASGQPVLSAVQHQLKHRHQGNRLMSGGGISLAAKIVQQNAQQHTSDNSGSDIDVGDASDTLVRSSPMDAAPNATPPSTDGAGDPRMGIT